MSDSSGNSRWRRYAYATNLLTSIASGLIAPFTVVFALRLGADAAMIGLLVSIPPLMSTLIQVLWARVTKVTGSRKPFVIASGLLNSVFWAVMGFSGTPIQLVALVGAQSLLVSMGSPAAWGLLTFLLPEKERGNVIGELNKYAYVGALLGTLAAGPTLDILGTEWGYRTIFLAAALVNLAGVCAYQLGLPDARIDPAARARTELPPDKKEQLLRFIAVRSLFTLSVNLAGPYIVVYLIERFNVSNSVIGLMSVVSNVMSIATTSAWGAAVDSYGRVIIIALGSCLTSLLPLLVIVAGDVYVASIGYVAGGVFWSADGISSSAYLMDLTQGGDVEGSVAMFNAAIGLSNAVAPLLGAAITSLTGDMGTIFYLSALLRFVMGLASYFVLKEVYPHAKGVAIGQVSVPTGIIQFGIDRGVRFLSYIASRGTMRRVEERIEKAMEEVEEEEPLIWVDEF
ncbi:MAG TPA: MFS transporter [Thermoproteota archaeon]|nr:MFS transporter [Thermoproteota archaeon]